LDSVLNLAPGSDKINNLAPENVHQLFSRLGLQRTIAQTDVGITRSLRQRSLCVGTQSKPDAFVTVHLIGHLSFSYSFRGPETTIASCQVAAPKAAENPH
jgi:hypothetical protein